MLDFIVFFWPWTLSVIILLTFLAWWVPRILTRRRATAYLRRLKKWFPAESAIISYSRLMMIYLPLRMMILYHQKLLEPMNIDLMYLQAVMVEKADSLVAYSRIRIWNGCENPTVVLRQLEDLVNETGLAPLDIGRDHWPEWLKANLQYRIDQRQRVIAAELNFLRVGLEMLDHKLSEEETRQLLAGVRLELERGLLELEELSSRPSQETVSCSV